MPGIISFLSYSKSDFRFIAFGSPTPTYTQPARALGGSTKALQEFFTKYVVYR